MSDRSVVQKLHLRPGQRIMVIAPPPGFLNGLPDMPEGSVADGVEQADIVLAFVEDRSQLEEIVSRLTALPGKGKALWVTYPKMSSGARTDINRDSIWAWARTKGMEKDRSLSDAWDREYGKPDPLWKGPPREDLPSMKGGRVLELGCGNGKTTAALVRSGQDIVGIDFSRKGLEACREAVTSTNLFLVEADVRHLPFSNGSFDHVVAFHVFGHLMAEDRARAVEEVLRVLRPGGDLLVRVFSQRDMRCGRGDEIEPGTYMKGTGIPCHFFDADEMGSLFGGFVPQAIEEVKVSKRFDGVDRVRAEWVAMYRRP